MTDLTPESRTPASSADHPVDPDQPEPAPATRRLQAWMLDWLFIGLGWILIAIFSPGPIAGSMFLPDLLSEWSLLLWLFGYRPVSTLLWHDTPAKRLLGIYVGDRAGYPLSTIRVLGRELSFLVIGIVPLAILANVIFLMFSSEQRSFHDLAAASDVYLDN